MKKFGRPIVSRYNSYRLKERSKLYLVHFPHTKSCIIGSLIYFTFQPFLGKSSYGRINKCFKFHFLYTYTRDNTYGRALA